MATAVMLMSASRSDAAERRVAPPSTPPAVAQCQTATDVASRTSDVPRPVQGATVIGGCVADVAGIAHVLLEWEDARGDVGRICTDPRIVAEAWRCRWDTSLRAPGAYVVRFIAIDAAGNRGTFEQAFAVEAADPRRVHPPAESPPVAPDPVAPAPAEPSPAEPPRPEPTPPAPEPTPPDPSGPQTPDPQAPEPGAPVTSFGAGATPPVETDGRAALRRLVDRQLAVCDRLVAAPGVGVDAALSAAVHDCMEPILRQLGAGTVELDPVPVPPGVRAMFDDAGALAFAADLVPAEVAGVQVELAPAR